MLTRKFLSLLMSLLLTLSPFASFGVAADFADKEHCMMMDSNGATPDMHHAHNESGHTMPACKHRVRHTCAVPRCYSPSHQRAPQIAIALVASPAPTPRLSTP
jgi:hypothetical protein